MSKTNCLLGISMFDLSDTEFVEKLILELKEDNFSGERLTYVTYNRIYYNINRLCLIDVVNKSQIYLDETIVEDWTSFSTNSDNYILFNIDWADSILENELDNSHIDFLIKPNILISIHKYGSLKLREDTSLYRIASRSMVLCFEFYCSQSYEGDYDSDLTFKGIMDMNNINLIGL